MTAKNVFKHILSDLLAYNWSWLKMLEKNKTTINFESFTLEVFEREFKPETAQKVDDKQHKRLVSESSSPASHASNYRCTAAYLCWKDERTSLVNCTKEQLELLQLSQFNLETLKKNLKTKTLIKFGTFCSILTFRFLLLIENFESWNQIFQVNCWRLFVNSSLLHSWNW